MSDIVERSIHYSVRINVYHHDNVSESELYKRLDEEMERAVNGIEGINSAKIRLTSSNKITPDF